MFNLLLDGEAASGNNGNFWSQNWPMILIIAVMVIAVVLLYVFGSRKRKKQEKDAQDLINAVKPGNKVKTIGGICGIVVEVDNEENTFVLETGTETTGKSYMKFDRQAIYQTDAVVDKTEPAKEADETTPAEVEATTEAPAAEPVTEEPVAEANAATEEQPELVKPKKKSKKPEEEKQVKF